jgi:hypothetical protein
VTTPFLTPEDLGIKLDEDSEDVSDLDFEQAVFTESIEEFSKLLSLLIEQSKEEPFIVERYFPKYALRRKCGVLLCRVAVGSRTQLFRIDWLQNT